MNVVIVGKTRMGRGLWCIGALRLNDWSSCRLLPIGNDHAWPANTAIEVGQVFEVEGAHLQDVEPPHVEDFRLTACDPLGDYQGDLPRDICTHVPVLRGPARMLFEGCLKRMLGSPTTNVPPSVGVRRDGVPGFSTQFWIADRDLPHYRRDDDDKDYYRVGRSKVKYVGSHPAVNQIPAGSLVRLSLARWYATGDREEACYLQVSGWWITPVGGSW